MHDDQPTALPPEFFTQPLTARMLDDFAVCPHKFLLSFFATRSHDTHFRGAPAILHQALRQALIELYRLGGPAKCSIESVTAAFDRHWDGSLCKDSVEEERTRRTGLLLLEKYHADQAHAERVVIATDRRYEGEVGGQRFVAVADVCLEDAESTHIVRRFVSSRYPLSETELAKDISARLLFILAHDNTSAELHDRLRITYYALRQSRERPVLLSSEEVEYARRDILSRSARIHRETEFTPVKGKHCRWCRSQDRCPLWQR